MKIVNPATGVLIEEMIVDSKESLKNKFTRLQQGRRAWRDRSLEGRMKCIHQYKQLLSENIESLAKLLSDEMGKPLQEAKNEIKGACYRIKYFLENSAQWLTPQTVNNDGTTKEILTYEPLGVIANISAWNYPYLIGVNVHIPALISGNAVLYKPSELTTLTGLRMQALFYEAGVPEDVFITAIGDGALGEAILELPIKGLFFTGSYKTGCHIQACLASRLIPVSVELGGKDPLYVMDDVKDISQSARSAVEGAFYNNGQSCCSVERIYVHDSIYDQFVNDFIAAVKLLKVGDPLTPDINQGALARPEQIPFLLAQIEDAVSKGAQIKVGGKSVPGKGLFFEPTVLLNVNHSMQVMTEETFGPVVGIQRVMNDEEALKWMNDTEYGLTASVFSANADRANHILEALEVGNAYYNCSDRVSPYLPWAGQRHSGLGATLGYLGILAFVRPKGWHCRSLV